MAAGKGDVQAASSALLAGADVNALDDAGLTPLMVAVSHTLDYTKHVYHWLVWCVQAREGGPIMTELLILNGAERDRQEEEHQQTALHLATLHGHYTVVCLLVKVGPSPKRAIPVDTGKRLMETR